MTWDLKIFSVIKLKLNRYTIFLLLNLGMECIWNCSYLIFWKMVFKYASNKTMFVIFYFWFN